MSLSSGDSAKALGKLIRFYVRNRHILIHNRKKKKMYTARYLSVLQMIYEAIAYKIMVTKRDMFYRNVSLFNSQTVLDSVNILK